MLAFLVTIYHWMLKRDVRPDNWLELLDFVDDKLELSHSESVAKSVKDESRKEERNASQRRMKNQLLR